MMQLSCWLVISCDCQGVTVKYMHTHVCTCGLFFGGMPIPTIGQTWCKGNAAPEDQKKESLRSCSLLDLASL